MDIMKKQPEKQPIDDLFARKLGNMSLPPSDDGFARLQARMGQGKQEAKVVFWRNPAMQRYMAAAACLLLVCLFGWLYLPSSGTSPLNGVQVATTQSKKSTSIAKKSAQKQIEEESSVDNRSTDLENDRLNLEQRGSTEQVAQVNKSSEVDKQSHELTNVPVNTHKASHKPLSIATDRPVLAQTSPANNKANPEVIKQEVTQPTVQPVIEQIAESKPITKPAPTAERVLVVTIAEPEALVAAREAARTAVEEKSVAADKPEKETKSGGLWQQVKRIKQGEVFARGDNTNDDERGLLGRAYTGLKHSLDKDKSAKQ
ncbi:hypothetical protein GCM10028810_53350 [Spirosoma litoris]